MRTGAATMKLWAALLAAVAAVMVVALAAGNEPANAAFPGSNGAIAFDDNSQIYRMDADGFGLTRISSAAQRNVVPDWSADGKLIAFQNVNNLSFEVYWMDSDGTDEENLTDHPAGDFQPAFFPDYHKIAFVSNRTGNNDIFKMTLNDSGTVTDGPTQLTTSTASDFEPAVSPDGKKIAFVSARDGDDDIYVMKANSPESSTNKAIKLTKSASSDTSPEWSPGGKKIAFVSRRSGNNEVYVMKPVPESRTNRPKNLTKHPGADIDPAFSPDGRKIAFASDRQSGSFFFDIFKMNADGSGPVRISRGGGDVSPTWQPDP